MERVPLNRTGKRRGGSILELALILPWYIFLFVGVYDWGFYSHALLSMEAATRTAAWNASKNPTTAVDNVTACKFVRAEMGITSNVAATGACNSLPLIVTTNNVPGPDGSAAALVTVRYQTQNLFPIPGLLAGQVTLTRTLQMRLRN